MSRMTDMWARVPADLQGYYLTVSSEAMALYGEQLAALGTKARKIVADSVMAGAQPIVTAAKAGVGNLSGQSTGLLKARLAARRGRNDYPGRFAAIIQSVTTVRGWLASGRQTAATRRGEAPGNLKSRYKVWHGVPLEFGHDIVRYVSGAKKVVGHVAGHPFMGPAVKSQGATAESIMLDKLDSGLNAANS